MIKVVIDEKAGTLGKIDDRYGESECYLIYIGVQGCVHAGDTRGCCGQTANEEEKSNENDHSR